MTKILLRAVLVYIVSLIANITYQIFYWLFISRTLDLSGALSATPYFALLDSVLIGFALWLYYAAARPRVGLFRLAILVFLMDFLSSYYTAFLFDDFGKNFIPYIITFLIASFFVVGLTDAAIRKLTNYKESG